MFSVGLRAQGCWVPSGVSVFAGARCSGCWAPSGARCLRVPVLCSVLGVFWCSVPSAPGAGRLRVPGARGCFVLVSARCSARWVPSGVRCVFRVLVARADARGALMCAGMELTSPTLGPTFQTFGGRNTSSLSPAHLKNARRRAWPTDRASYWRGPRHVVQIVLLAGLLFCGV